MTSDKMTAKPESRRIMRYLTTTTLALTTSALLAGTALAGKPDLKIGLTSDASGQYANSGASDRRGDIARDPVVPGLGQRRCLVDVPDPFARGVGRPRYQHQQPQNPSSSRHRRPPSSQAFPLQTTATPGLHRKRGQSPGGP